MNAFFKYKIGLEFAAEEFTEQAELAAEILKACEAAGMGGTFSPHRKILEDMRTLAENLEFLGERTTERLAEARAAKQERGAA